MYKILEFVCVPSFTMVAMYYVLSPAQGFSFGLLANHLANTGGTEEEEGVAVERGRRGGASAAGEEVDEGRPALSMGKKRRGLPPPMRKKRRGPPPLTCGEEEEGACDCRL
jgi:hypothetical protein